ncbi:hypothetical protein CDEST_14734 [Colletotrichum destructivum]|uniref:Uncharacterized protein n=1 Tax=Colletotrichum destructivum TaxID=34406 RepID=A0AAX4J315_9PEZI|nr:hypothetical protein CDEST_14734 [Colletotrichum destructivum]
MHTCTVESCTTDERCPRKSTLPFRGRNGQDSPEPTSTAHRLATQSLSNRAIPVFSLSPACITTTDGPLSVNRSRERTYRSDDTIADEILLLTLRHRLHYDRCLSRASFLVHNLLSGLPSPKWQAPKHHRQLRQSQLQSKKSFRGI